MIVYITDYLRMANPLWSVRLRISAEIHRYRSTTMIHKFLASEFDDLGFYIIVSR